MRFSEFTQRMNGSINTEVPEELHYTTLLPFGVSYCYFSFIFLNEHLCNYSSPAFSFDNNYNKYCQDKIFK